MGNEDRQLKINKLKALRAELMAYKKFQNGETEEGNVEYAAMTLFRKTYIEDNESIAVQNMDDLDALRRETYAQYKQTFDEEKIDSQGEQKNLIRRR